MAEYVIVTDSTTDLSQEMVEELELSVIPMEFSLEGKNYFNYPDGHEMNEKEFYAKLRQGSMAKTMQINVSQFIDWFSPLLEKGKDVLYIAFSSGLSGTYHSALLAKDELEKKYPDRKILVVDSLAASMGEGLLVYHAVMKKREGKSIDEVYSWVEENKLRLCHWFTVDDLGHLKRGGRVSSATSLLGTMLGIKPVMHVDDEGHLIPVSKVRGRRNSLEALFKNMTETVQQPKEQVVFISHGDSEEDAQWLSDLIKKHLFVKDVKMNYIGPVIGAHSGPGTVALFFLGSKR